MIVGEGLLCSITYTAFPYLFSFQSFLNGINRGSLYTHSNHQPSVGFFADGKDQKYGVCDLSEKYGARCISAPKDTSSGLCSET